MFATGASTDEITAECKKLMKSIRRGLEADDSGDATVAAPVSTATALAGDLRKLKERMGISVSRNSPLGQ